VSSTVAGIVIAAALLFLCFVYFYCIRKNNAKNKLVVLMDEAKLDDDVEIVDEAKDDEDWGDEEDDWD